MQHKYPHLLKALEQAASNEKPRLCWFDGTGNISHEYSYRSIHSESIHYSNKIAQELKNNHFESDLASEALKIGIIATTGPEFIILFMACLRIGAIPCILPTPGSLQDKSIYAKNITAMCNSADISYIIGVDHLIQHLEEIKNTNNKNINKINLAQLNAIKINPRKSKNSKHLNINPDDIAYIQFSSGSTSSPKGIAISHRALMHHIHLILQYGMQIHPDDIAFSWLPYYHDMGLVGFVLAPICAQVSVDYLAPYTFIRRPFLWLELISKRASSITYAPEFAWKLAAKNAHYINENCDLKNLRIAGVGGDHIDIEVMREFSKKYAQFNFNSNAWMPSYGLAEATLAVSFNHQGLSESLEYFAKDENNGAITKFSSKTPSSRHIVNCGKALPSWRIKICDHNGDVLNAMQEGHILLNGPSQLSGYYHNGKFQEISQSQYFDTGDIGFLSEDGNIFISGRSKDLIIINGKNIWPIDIEKSIHQQEKIPLEDIILIQKKTTNKKNKFELELLVHEKVFNKKCEERILKKLSEIATSSIGFFVDASTIPNGTIVFTSSGKKSRPLTECRIQSLRSQYTPSSRAEK